MMENIINFILNNILFIAIALCGLIAIVLALKLPKGKTLKAHILVEFGDTFKTVKIMKVPLTKREFTYNDKTFIVDLTKAIFDKKMTPNLYYRLDKTMPLTFNNVDQKVDSALLNTVVKSEVWKKMLSVSMVDKYMLILIIALIIALAVTACLGYYFITQTITKTATQTVQNATAIIRPVP